VTPQRQCIFRVLHGNGSHPTAHAVFESSVRRCRRSRCAPSYQTLNDLGGAGEIQQFDVGTGAARFDPATGAHHHLVCPGAERCATSTVTPLACASRRASTRASFISGAEVIFRGLCAQCSQVTSHQKKATRELEDQHV